jgi:uncharacterized membrane protein YsdA (DUF1294 family)/cold shock CspA family protein
MRHHGRLRDWNDERGFGFIAPSAGGDKVFVHITAFSNRGLRRPTEGDQLTYEIERDSQDRLRARDACYLDEATSAPRAATGSNVAAIVVAFYSTLVALAYYEKTSVFVPLLYLIVSGVTFWAYGSDKLAAVNYRWRTSENTLHWLSLLGGWPGALLAQRRYRHKTRKANFQAIYWLTVVLNCTALAWAVSGTWVAVLRDVFVVR